VPVDDSTRLLFFVFFSLFLFCPSHLHFMDMLFYLIRGAQSLCSLVKYNVPSRSSILLCVCCLFKVAAGGVKKIHMICNQQHKISFHPTQEERKKAKKNF
jgi:hypothetical protein